MSCPSATAYASVAVTITLSMSGARYFGASAQTVATSSTGINGQTTSGDYSVALLDPSNPNWTGHGGRTGCASYLVNAGVQLPPDVHKKFAKLIDELEPKNPVPA